MNRDVAIVGIGMHPFGRHEGVSGMEQGAHAVREACKDAGINWQDLQFAVGGSHSAGNPDTMVSMLGLSGLQFVNVMNGCATGGTALSTAYTTIKAGMSDIGIAIGFAFLIFFCTRGGDTPKRKKQKNKANANARVLLFFICSRQLC